MYRHAPINADERHHSRVQCASGRARVVAPVKAEYCHTAGALHGSSYFKMLDDAAFFAAQTVNADFFVVTTSFTTYITKAIAPSPKVTHLVATGRVTSQSKSLILAEAVVTTPDGAEVGRGSGTFMPHPKFALAGIPQYNDDAAFPFTDEDALLEDAEEALAPSSKL